jgi:type IV secretory pathway VirB10-like protein
MIASTVLTSAFTLGASLAMQAVAPSNAANTTTISNISSGTTSTVSGAYNQVTLEVTKNILNIMKDIVDRAIDTTPVIRVPQGTKITVMATTDIQLPAAKKRY